LLPYILKLYQTLWVNYYYIRRTYSGNQNWLRDSKIVFYVDKFLAYIFSSTYPHQLYSFLKQYINYYYTYIPVASLVKDDAKRPAPVPIEGPAAKQQKV